MAVSNTLPPSAAQAPAAATPAVATLAAVAGQAWRLSGILYSYSAAPTGGSLTIAWGTASIVLAVPASGPGQLLFPEPLRFPVNTQVVVTLASGGGAVVGTVYPIGFTG